MNKAAILLLVALIMLKAGLGQRRAIEGLVLDSLNHNPLPNASVLVAGTGRGVLTNAQGRFRIMAGMGMQSIRVSAAGYHSREVTVPDSSKNALSILLGVSYDSL